MKKSIFFLSLVLLLAACRKDSNEIFVIDDEFTPTVTEIQNPVTATIFGIVEDEAGNPIADAEVYLFGQKKVTSIRGHFVFANVMMDEAGTFLQVRKAGYFEGSTRFFPKEDSENYTKVTLLRETIIGSLNASTGGTVEAPSGIRLAFPANAIISRNGEKYTGEFQIAAKWLDPTDKDLNSKMPGDLSGINNDNNEVALASFGMMAVNLFGENGEKLNLGNGKEATLSFPLTENMAANAPTTIPLWFFDENKGIWQQEGDDAVLEGDYYVGNVRHFSFWNCDYPYPLIQLSGTIISSQGNPFSSLKVILTLNNSGNTACGYTNNLGDFSGKVPMGEIMELTVFDVNDCIYYTANIGPFSEDTDLDDIIIDSIHERTVIGTAIDCDDAPLTEGLATITVDNQKYYDYLNGDNQFNLSFLNCNNDNIIAVEVINYADLSYNPVSFHNTTNSLIDVGQISACGNSLGDYIKLTIDGEARILPGEFTEHNAEDTLYISSIVSLGNVRVKLADIVGVGEYSNDNVDWMLIGMTHSIHGSISGYCDTECMVSTVNITTLGNSGEKVEGQLSGDIEINNSGGLVLPYEIEFSLTLQ